MFEIIENDLSRFSCTIRLRKIQFATSFDQNVVYNLILNQFKMETFTILNSETTDVLFLSHYKSLQFCQ